MKTKMTICLCALLMTCPIATHAQRMEVKEKNQDWKTVFTLGDFGYRIDSITIEKIDGNFINKIHYHFPLPDQAWSTATYKTEDIEYIRFYDLDALNTILSVLRERGNYTYFLRLIDDIDAHDNNSMPLNYLLGGKGYFNVFVAEDSAWEKFFKQNATLPEQDTWHNATSYDRLSIAQKHLLAHTAMVSTSFRNNILNANKMFFDTSVIGTDSLSFVSSNQLPYSYSPTEKDYWARFRTENGGNGIYIHPLAPQNRIIMFNDNFCFQNLITDEDRSFITGKSAQQSEIQINNATVTSTYSAYNGIIHSIDVPLRPQPSISEAIRINGRTNIFSHILDRFCVPYYDAHDAELTSAYKWEHPEFVDSVFTLYYFPGPNTKDDYYPYKTGSPDCIPYLNLPDIFTYWDWWNGKDMPSIFVPNDEAMWHYFQNAGEELIRTYYAHEGTKDEIPYTKATTLEELYRQIDCIPLGTLDKFINNLMQTSFVNSVPSKWNRLTDDTGTSFFQDVVEAWNQLDTCLMANNGVVYVMGHVIVPPDYYSVTGPAVISQTNKIIKSALYDDWGYNSGKSGRNYYSSILKNTRNRYTFLLPSDSALFYYYDPVSMKCRIPNVVEYYLAEGSFPAKLRRRNYYCPYNQRNGNVGTIGNVIPGISTYTNEEAANRMMEIVENHIIVQDGTNPMTRWEQIRFGWATNSPLNEYYLSNRGNAVKVIRDEDDNIIAVKGGFQLENERLGIVGENPGISSCQVKKIYDYVGNGNTLVLDAPLVPTYRSVYSIFTNDADQLAAGKEGFGGETPYSAFYDLCNANDYEAEIVGCGLAEGKSEAQKYMAFIEHNGLDYNVQFFNSCQDHNPNSFSSNHYTIFVPTNEAIQEAINAGLPTWEGIREDYRSHCKPQTNELATTEDSIRIAAKITYLTNFVRYHFAEKSVFADRCELAPNEFVSFCFDKDSEEMCKLHVARIGSSDGTRLCVCDDMTWQKNAGSMGNNPFATVGERNVLARDISCSKSPVEVQPKGITIEASSAAVIHNIPGCLHHTELPDGRYDKIWETTESAREYLRKYPVQ